MEELLSHYANVKEELKSRLKQFKDLSEEAQFKEFLFCLLTPQSNAQRCWQAVEEISRLPEIEEQAVYNILKTKTRFHITKTQRILKAYENWHKIKPFLENENIKELRNKIAQTVNGYGLKESGHFLRNIGLSNNQIAILDRHILRNLHNLKVIKDPKIKSPKNYLEIEDIFLNFSKSINIPADELDLLWWSKENGEIFK
ncbi:MAG: DNA lyase [Nanoarchaeota archaeon]|nr:DNA lyase [Nanoarchaeota archaeon]